MSVFSSVKEHASDVTQRVLQLGSDFRHPISSKDDEPDYVDPEVFYLKCSRFRGSRHLTLT